MPDINDAGKAQQQAPPENVQATLKMLEDAKSGVVHIKAETATGISDGSGFFVDKSGHILTALHVVKGAGRIALRTADGKVLPASVVATDQEHDLAVLKAPLTPEASKPLPLKPSADLKTGDEVASIGHPFGSLESQVRAGDYQFHLQLSPLPYRTITSPITSPGVSGGPLINQRGEAVGITSGARETANSEFALSEAAMELLGKADKKRFQVSHTPAGLAGKHLEMVQNYPLLAAADLGGLSALGYGGYRLAQQSPKLVGAGLLTTGLGLAFNDAFAYCHNDRETMKYNIALGTDLGIIGGAALSFARRRAGLAIAGTALIGRLATEFYPTRTELKINDR